MRDDYDSAFVIDDFSTGTSSVSIRFEACISAIEVRLILDEINAKYFLRNVKATVKETTRSDIRLRDER